MTDDTFKVDWISEKAQHALDFTIPFPSIYCCWPTIMSSWYKNTLQGEGQCKGTWDCTQGFSSQAQEEASSTKLGFLNRLRFVVIICYIDQVHELLCSSTKCYFKLVVCPDMWTEPTTHLEIECICTEHYSYSYLEREICRSKGCAFQTKLAFCSGMYTETIYSVAASNCDLTLPVRLLWHPWYLC